MANKRDALLRMIAFFESIGKVVEADALREIKTNLHDSRVVIKYGIDNNLLAAGKIPEGATTTIGNTCAELGKDNELRVPCLGELTAKKAEAKLFIDANVWDGEDRSGATNDRASFDPDDLQELVDDLIEHMDK